MIEIVNSDSHERGYVLAVDDNPDHLRLLQRQLGDDEKICLVTCSGQLAVTTALRTYPKVAVAVLDLRLTGQRTWSGLALAQWLRGEYPDLPLIFVSSEGNFPGFKKWGRRNSRWTFIQKGRPDFDTSLTSAIKSYAPRLFAVTV